LAVSPIIIYAAAIRTASILVKNGWIALVAGCMGYFSLVTAHWIAIAIFGDISKSSSPTDNGPAHGLMLAIFISYVLGAALTICFAILRSIQCAWRAVRAQAK
jgi:hypothetical protein